MLIATKYKHAIFSVVVFYSILYIKDILHDASKIDLIKEEFKKIIIRSNMTFSDMNLFKVILILLNFVLIKNCLKFFFSILVF
jgi:hypothetical protein